MKAWTLSTLLVSVVLLFPSACLADDAAADVKNTSWGMNKAQVKKAVLKKPVKEEDAFLIYRYSTFNTDCFVFYSFEDPGEHLSEVSYVFKPKSKSEADYIYSTMSAYLVKAYKLSENSGATQYLSSTVLKYENGTTHVALANNYKSNKTVTVTYAAIGSLQKGKAR